MYEEDRNRALEMYNEIFDEVNNETAVLQLLVSPTRQAVNLARAYDARERKYQSDDGEEPAYQLVIEDLRRQAGTLMPEEPKFRSLFFMMRAQPTMSSTAWASRFCPRTMMRAPYWRSMSSRRSRCSRMRTKPRNPRRFRRRLLHLPNRTLRMHPVRMWTIFLTR